MAHEIKSQSTKLRIKHLGHMRVVENELLNDDDDMLTQSGRINIKRVSESALDQHNSSGLFEQTDKFSSISYRDGA